MKAVHRTVGGLLPARLLSRSYPGIPGRVHVNDLMLRSESPPHVRHYVSDACSAIDNLEASLELAGRDWSDVRAFLDLPSGYGRVTRFLVQRLDPARVTAGDVDRQAVRFCVAEFGVNGVVADRDPARTRFPGRYDVAFVGSLLTHLPEAAVVDLVRALVATLVPGGLLVFSTQGESCLDHLDWYGERFKRHEAEFRHAVGACGRHFVPYPGADRYAIAIQSRSWIDRLVERTFGTDLSLLRFAERGWNGHQDVWTYRLGR